MPSEFSSEGSVTDAERLAKNLGIEFDVVPVRAVFEQFSRALEPFFDGTTFGLAEENLQPRIRGSLLMAFSNKQGGLVLTTGNKSEMATGYCTLYGDMVGALAVIGDLYKTEVYALSRYANRSARSFRRRQSIRSHRQSCGRGRRTRTRCHRTRCSIRFCGRMWRTTVLPTRLRRSRVDVGLVKSHPARRTERVQAAAGGAGVEGHEEGIWYGQALSHCGEGSGLDKSVPRMRQRRMDSLKISNLMLAGLTAVLSVSAVMGPNGPNGTGPGRLQRQQRRRQAAPAPAPQAQSLRLLCRSGYGPTPAIRFLRRIQSTLRRRRPRWIRWMRF